MEKGHVITQKPLFTQGDVGPDDTTLNIHETIIEIVPAADNCGFSVAIALIDWSEAHVHREREEEYILISGALDVYIGREVVHLERPGQSVVIPKQTIHRAESMGRDTAIIAVKCTPPWTPDDHILVTEDVPGEDRF